MDDCLQEHRVKFSFGPFYHGGGADHKCLGRGGRQTVVTEGGVQDGLVERR